MVIFLQPLFSLQKLFSCVCRRWCARLSACSSLLALCKDTCEGIAAAEQRRQGFGLEGWKCLQKSQGGLSEGRPTSFKRLRAPIVLTNIIIYYDIVYVVNLQLSHTHKKNAKYFFPPYANEVAPRAKKKFDDHRRRYPPPVSKNL